MDQSSFDRLARLLGGAASRRAGLGAALGGLLGLAALDGADAGRNKGKGKGKDKGKGPSGPGKDKEKGRGRPGLEGPCGNGSRKANVCSDNSDCCTGLCKRRKNKDGEGRCRCVQRGRACTEDRNCCNTMACKNGTCGEPQPVPPVPGALCATTADCGAGMSCSSGKCFDITPCPAPFSSGSWGVFDIAYNYENEGEGYWPGTLDQPVRLAMLPDRSAFLTVEPYRNRIQKFDAYTFELIDVMSAPTGADKIPPAGTGDGEFNTPNDVLISQDGAEAYVFDQGNSRITVIDPVAWTVLRQIPISSSIFPGSLTLEDNFRGSTLDPVRNAVLFVIADESYQTQTAGICIVPIDGSAQSGQTLTWHAYSAIAASNDGSRIYLGGTGAVEILDAATFQSVGIRGAWQTSLGSTNCRTGFGDVMFQSGAMSVDPDGRLWVGDYQCKLATQWDVTNDQFSLVTWFGGGDEFEPIAPILRADGTILFWNYDSDSNLLTTRCRNTDVPDGQPWRSAATRLRRG